MMSDFAAQRRVAPHGLIVDVAFDPGVGQGLDQGDFVAFHGVHRQIGKGGEGLGR